MKKRILVTGAGGFIGGRFIKYLCELNEFEIFAVTRGSIPFEHCSINWIHTSLEDLSSIFQNYGDLLFDTVYHIAGFIPKISTDANNIKRNVSDNINATNSLCEALGSNFRKLVFISTIDVYSPEAPLPMSESSTVSPANLYGMSKLIAEKITSTYCQQNKRKFNILRLGHVYGPGEEKYSKIIPVLLRNSIEGKETTISGNGQAERDFIYIDDVCRILKAFSEIVYDGPVNIAAGRRISIRDTVEIVNRVTGDQTRVYYSGEVAQAHSIYFDNNLLVSLLGPGFSFTRFEDGIAHEFKYFKKVQLFR